MKFADDRMIGSMEGNENSEITLRSNNSGTLLQGVTTAQSSQVKGRVFVTVGSSPDACFDDLVKTVMTPKCLQVLKERGYTSLVIHHGNGPFLPTKSKEYDNFKIEHFRSRPNIEELISDHIYATSLVISFVGAESIFQILRAPRPLIVVLSNQLLGEYRLELAEQLAKYMYGCTPETLVETLSIIDVESSLSDPLPFEILVDLVKSLQDFQAKPTAPSTPVRGRVFVTVGQSPEARFDDLVQTLITPKCLRVLKKRGYTSLVVHFGNGRFLPTKSKAYDYLQVKLFGSRPNVEKLISDHINAASLVISSVGAETIFKTLRAQRPLVVVQNNQLLGKYGLELAKQLSKFMYCCSPETLVETLTMMDVEPLLPYPPHPPPFNVMADLNMSFKKFCTSNEALAPFKETENSAIPTPESQIVEPHLSSLEQVSASNKKQTNVKSILKNKK